MSGETHEAGSYVDRISRSIVAEVASDELEFFDELANEYYADPSPQKAKDTELGSGLGAGLAVVTPAAIAMVSAVLSNILGDEEIRKDTGDYIKGKLRKSLQRRSKGKQPEESPAPLTEKQLTRIRKIARAEAKRFGVEDETAMNMANALIGSIVVSLGT